MQNKSLDKRQHQQKETNARGALIVDYCSSLIFSDFITYYMP